MWPWYALPWNFWASETGWLDNHGVTALRGSSGEDENSALGIYIDKLRARDAKYRVVEKSKKARMKRRRVTKDLEEDIQAAEGTVHCPGIADWLNVISCGDLWWDSQSKSGCQLSYRNGGLVLLPCTGCRAQSLPYILDIQNYIFLKDEWQGIGMNFKKIPGPTKKELIFLESSTFSSAAVPKVSSSLKNQKERSVQSQLRFILKLHNQGFTSRVFYKFMKPHLVCRLRPVCVGRRTRSIHPETLGILFLDFELMQDPWFEFLVIFYIFAPWYGRRREASSVKIL